MPQCQFIVSFRLPQAGIARGGYDIHCHVEVLERSLVCFAVIAGVIAQYNCYNTPDSQYSIARYCWFLILFKNIKQHPLYSNCTFWIASQIRIYMHDTMHQCVCLFRCLWFYWRKFSLSLQVFDTVAGRKSRPRASLVVFYFERGWSRSETFNGVCWKLPHLC